MKTVQAAENVVTIRCAEAEIPSGESLRRMVERVLSENGYEPWPGIEAECFRSEGEVLVIARPGSKRRAFRFADMDALCAAVSVIPAESALYRVQDGFLLIPARKNGTSGLYEFGEPVTLEADWSVHAREQGLCLAERNAAAYLRRRIVT